MDLLLDGTIGKEDYEFKKQRLREQQRDIYRQMESQSNADENFNNTLISLLKLSAKAWEVFQGSTVVKKRELVNLVFANLQLNGASLCYSLRKPFDAFVNCHECQEWRAFVDSLRTPETHLTLKFDGVIYSALSTAA
jgi:hypothetical protein